MDSQAQRIAHLFERLGRLIANDGHHRRLKPVQWEALRYLSKANRFSRTPSALTAYLGSTKGTVSQTVMALQRNGWLKKRPGDEDKRSVRLELTAAGQDLLREDPLEQMCRAASHLDDEQQLILEGAMQKILEERLSATEGRTFGMCRSCRFFQADSPEGNPHRCALLEVPLGISDARQICAEYTP